MPRKDTAKTCGGSQKVDSGQVTRGDSSGRETPALFTRGVTEEFRRSLGSRIDCSTSHGEAQHQSHLRVNLMFDFFKRCWFK
ncbi:MAG TPA: hypothetical protein V6D35_10370 [Candidatus Sericytochromatia bacterium]